jgi:stage II sporulation SpoE-like protein
VRVPADENKALVRRFFEEAWIKRNPAAVDVFMAADYVEHASIPGSRSSGRDGQRSSDLWARGMPLGLMPRMSYEENETALEGGESILFYSDGLVEAHNPHREMFGFPRLREVVYEYGSAGGSLVERLMNEPSGFAGAGSEQEDDITLVVLQRLRTT